MRYSRHGTPLAITPNPNMFFGSMFIDGEFWYVFYFIRREEGKEGVGRG
jgi:hypothetical protein